MTTSRLVLIGAGSLTAAVLTLTLHERPKTAAFAPQQTITAASPDESWLEDTDPSDVPPALIDSRR